MANHCNELVSAFPPDAKNNLKYPVVDVDKVSDLPPHPKLFVLLPEIPTQLTALNVAGNVSETELEYTAPAAVTVSAPV